MKNWLKKSIKEYKGNFILGIISDVPIGYALCLMRDRGGWFYRVPAPSNELYFGKMILLGVLFIFILFNNNIYKKTNNISGFIIGILLFILGIIILPIIFLIPIILTI